VLTSWYQSHLLQLRTLHEYHVCGYCSEAGLDRRAVIARSQDCCHFITPQCWRVCLPVRLHMATTCAWCSSVLHTTKSSSQYPHHLLHHTSGWQIYFNTFRHIWHGAWIVNLCWYYVSTNYVQFWHLCLSIRWGYLEI
jgi:hypothetical protein